MARRLEGVTKAVHFWGFSNSARFALQSALPSVGKIDDFMKFEAIFHGGQHELGSSTVA